MIERLVMWTVRLTVLFALGAIVGGLLGLLPLHTAETVAAVVLGGGSLLAVLVVFAVAGIKDLLDAPQRAAEASWLDTYSAHNEQAAVAGKRRC